MKTTIIKCAGAFCLASLLTCANAQIKVFPQNKVQVGPIWAGAPSQQLFVNGDSYFSCVPAPSGFYVQNTHLGTGFDLPAIIPQWGSRGLIGNAKYPFFEIYTQNIYTLNGAVYGYSDRRLKTNITEVSSSSALDKILAIQSYKYDFKDTLNIVLNTDSAMATKLNYANQFGFIAQELMEVMPELVKESEGFYTVNYVGLIPILVEAMKKQQEQIRALQDALASH